MVVPGFGAELVWPAAGAAVDLAPAAADFRADADGDAEPEDPLAVGAGLAPALCPLVGWFCAADAAPAVLPVVLAKSVVMPNAVTTLSKVVRQVMRDSRRSPESRPAVRLLCLMTATQPVARLRAHQDRASDSLIDRARGPILPDRRATQSCGLCRADGAAAAPASAAARPGQRRGLSRPPRPRPKQPATTRYGAGPWCG